MKLLRKTEYSLVGNGKWKRLLGYSALTMGMYGLIFMVGAKYIIQKSKEFL